MKICFLLLRFQSEIDITESVNEYEIDKATREKLLVHKDRCKEVTNYYSQQKTQFESAILPYLLETDRAVKKLIKKLQKLGISTNIE